MTAGSNPTAGGPAGAPGPAGVPAPTATIRWGSWFGDTTVDLDFPAGWGVRTAAPPPAATLGRDDIVQALRNPTGTPPLRQLARGRQRPCIVIDDLSRPTRGAELLPPLLEELAAAGIEAADVMVLVGVANHRTMMRADLEKKLGPEVLTTTQVRGHFSWRGCVPVGTTSRGIPLEVNRRFMEADLRILVGSIVPHPVAGFSGGAKLLLPALCSNRTAEAFHRGPPNPGDGVGVVETAARADAEEAARMVGVDFILNTSPGPDGSTAAVVAGDLVAAHREGCRRAQALFGTEAPAAADVVVLSSFPKDNEFMQYPAALSPIQSSPGLVRDGGTVVMCTAASEGMGFHSLFGPDMAFTPGTAPPVAGTELVVFSPGVTPLDLEPDARDGLRLFATWAETRDWLAAHHRGATTVTVFPSAVTQLVGDPAHHHQPERSDGPEERT